ncbi:MAG: tetratricopeptide repeat protein [Solidesulfovibrio sp. DCME]|uniref:tetratricopeptide repeat protein n=1 Tax=Solidesulfovibrio sp. DCME TaxID=3447380 RepID=UPI003D0CE4A8
MADNDRPTFSRRHLVRALLGREIPKPGPQAEAPDRHAAAEAAYAAGDYPAAVTAYRASVRGDLSNPEARLRLGHALFATGQMIQARVEFEHVLRLTDGAAPTARLLLGLTLLALGKREKAASQLAAFTDPDRPELETAAREAASRLENEAGAAPADTDALATRLLALAHGTALLPETHATA